MKELAVNILGMHVPENRVGVFFLGQAGFVLKTPESRLIMIDPYLSDCCNRYFGFKRLMPFVLDAGDLAVDYLISSHAHYDHFDVDSVPTLMANGKTEFFGALDTKPECERLNLKDRLNFLAVGDTVERPEMKLTAVNCDHGKDTPYAIGLLLETAGKKIYFMGDTCFRDDWYSDPAIMNPDLLILPINGAYGNLNEKEAAKVVTLLKPKTAVPCHYWNFAIHGGSPIYFLNAMEELDPAQSISLMRQGEGILL